MKLMMYWYCCKENGQEQFDVYMMTSDKDYGQLTEPTILYTGQSMVVMITKYLMIKSHRKV